MGRFDQPQDELVLERLGDLRGKRVLLLGNGVSLKEIAFVAQEPKLLVHSDLSLNAVLWVRESVAGIAASSPIVYAAIDAADIPFEGGSFDVVYGYAMVHHLERVDDFVAGVVRVLAPGGEAVFMDDGYAPAWQASKMTWLRPLMAYSHRRTGISPEDTRATLAGGFREEDLARTIESVGGNPWFQRTSLVTYLLYRASEKLLPARLDAALRRPCVARRVCKFDEWAARFELVRKNQIRLVWGLAKD
jgi:2-polyprenyl-3-methyl-5-hydroxy-6-metoxy-1,4-benzoquinol methylase